MSIIGLIEKNLEKNKMSMEKNIEKKTRRSCLKRVKNIMKLIKKK